MKFLKINITYSKTEEYFIRKYPNYKEFNYDKFTKKLYKEANWQSYNALERNLKKLYSWDSSSLLFCLGDEFNELVLDKWKKKHNIKENYNSKEDNLLMQIIYYKPDIIYFTDIPRFNKELFEKIRFLLKDVIIFGWNGSSASYKAENFNRIDKIFTCFEPIKKHYTRSGINCINVGHFFDKKIINKINKNNEKQYDVVFAGHIDFISYCNKRKLLLEKLVLRGINITIFGESDSKILKPYCKTHVYGIEYYKILKSAKIVLNIHAANNDTKYSGNIRTYETTGIGTFLLADFKEDLNSKFLLDKEIVVYKDMDDAVKKIEYYLKNEKEREKIARAGRKKTLKNYGYDKFAEIIYDEVMNIKNNPTKYMQNCFENIKLQKNDKRTIFKDFANSLVKQTQKIINNYDKIALYGNGNIASMIKKYIPNLVVIADRQNPKNCKNICHPDDLNDYEFDAIIVTVFGQDEYIVDYLINSLKLPKNKIVLFELN